MEMTKSARARVSEALRAENDAAKPLGRNSTFASRTLAPALDRINSVNGCLTIDHTIGVQFGNV
jgi:hypothetical protein